MISEMTSVSTEEHLISKLLHCSSRWSVEFFTNMYRAEDKGSPFITSSKDAKDYYTMIS